MKRCCVYPGEKRGFTLVEMMVATGVFSLMLLALFAILNTTTITWQNTKIKIGEYSQIRDALASMTDRLGQATLNPYFDYDSLTAPTKYIRQSELRFISGNASEIIDATGASTDKHTTHCVFFQAPLGLVNNASQFSNLKNLLNTFGYFIEYSSNAPYLPTFLGGKGEVFHFRLMELNEPSENLNVYRYTSGLDKYNNPNTLSFITNPALTGFSLNGTPASGLSGREWFLNSLYPSNGSKRPVHVLADNVIALIILPKLPEFQDPTTTALAPNYNYDSTGVNQAKGTTNLITAGDLNSLNQLPPILQITLVVLDEMSAARITAHEASELQDLLGGLFKDATKYNSDLFISDPITGKSNSGSLQNYLVQHGWKFKIITTDVLIKQARWSKF